ncbi:MAG TPA: hypothetical protein VJA21_30520 [Verrucomicrobiae bacterium]
MLPIIKRFSWLALLTGGLQGSMAFSLLGPVNEAYQVPVIGYNLPEDVGAPKNYGQEYRRNTPVLYYTCDANFWDYFGARGVAEIDKAFAAFNRLTNVSKMSADLSEYPFAARRRNWKAESLALLDLKSWTMWMIIEQLGLAEPDRYVWTLHDRWLQPNTTCPLGELYLVIKRNFDPILGTSLDQLKPTSYINGVLYSYIIPEYCNAPLPPQAWGQAVPVDALAETFTAIASGFGYNQQFTYSPFGAYFTGLTRDDVGGLRYLLRTNNMNIESAGPNTFTLITNTVPQLLTTSNLTLLAAQAYTNDAAPLQALFPNLVVLSTSNYFTNIDITNVVAFFTNYPWDPIGTAAHLGFATNITPTIATRFVHSFGNLFGLVATSNGWVTVPMVTLPTETNGQLLVTVQLTSVALTNAPWMPFGTTNFVTNSFSTTFLTNTIVGEYIIVPTNSCEIAILHSQLTNFITFTNVILSATNFAPTGPGGVTNAGTVLSYDVQEISYFTNHTFVIYPVICDSTNVAVRQGVEKITFIRRDYDSLLTRFFIPITNEYVLNAVTNFQLIPNYVRRTVTAPDFLFTAQDLTAGPDARPYSPGSLRSIIFATNGAYAGIAGPGTIETPTLFTFNNVGPLYLNFGMLNTNAFLNELQQSRYYSWGSFDGTTNAPVVYPNDASVTDMEVQVLVQVSPPYLPAGTVGVAYAAQLQVLASTEFWQAPPPAWPKFFLAPNSPGLPPGLQISEGGAITGVPQASGVLPKTFDFVVRIMDSQGHKVDRSYAIRIDGAH